MIEDIRQGRAISIVDYQVFAEDQEWAFQANEAKKEYNRNQPKVYKNGTGKRYYADKKDKLAKATDAFINDLGDETELAERIL